MKHAIWMVMALLLGAAGCGKEQGNQPELKVSGPTMGTHYAVKVVGNYPGGEPQLQHDVEQVLGRRHAVAEHGPGGRGDLGAVVALGLQVVAGVVEGAHAATPAVALATGPRSLRRSSMMPCCALMDRSMTSRACAT